jgi:hypothetical protein
VLPGGAVGTGPGVTADSRIQNFLPSENSNLEVLKELGVDIQHEGRKESNPTKFGNTGSQSWSYLILRS